MKEYKWAVGLKGVHVILIAKNGVFEQFCRVNQLAPDPIIKREWRAGGL
jgi:hypothetical protein